MQTPAVGRHEELARLRAAVVAAASGAGRFVLVSGPAGIGKSWLAECVATLAVEAGLRVARGNALDDAGMPPLWPWRRAARELPELAAALDTVTEPGGGPEVRYWLEQRGRTTDLAQRVHERTDGTPLLVRLVIESGTDLGDDPLLSVPGIRRLILARLDRFDPAEVEILGAASVLGERIDADLLARVYTSVSAPAPPSPSATSAWPAPSSPAAISAPPAPPPNKPPPTSAASTCRTACDTARRPARRDPTATRTADPLTRREREIHDLVATGLTNREIATHLVLSERTVEDPRPQHPRQTRHHQPHRDHPRPPLTRTPSLSFRHS